MNKSQAPINSNEKSLNGVFQTPINALTNFWFSSWVASNSLYSLTICTWKRKWSISN